MKFSTKILALFAMAIATQAVAAGDSGQQPNILLIVADDLGYSDLGSYGGEIETPTLDSLASEGVQLTQFYTAPTCSPTRAMLMSGTDNHLAGLGTMKEALAPYQKGEPGYEGHLNDNVHWLPALLKDGGYRTLMAGKWHLGSEQSQWPVNRGFDRSFALLPGGGSHFKPVAEQPSVMERMPYARDKQLVKYADLPDDFYSTDYYTDQLIEYLEETRNSEKPFFAYAAYTAPHWPLQAPREYLDKYQGRYDSGFEQIRKERIERVRKLGLLPEDFVAASTMPASEKFPKWDQLTEKERRYEARKMEIYSAMVDNLDDNVGRLFDYLRETGQYENTMIVFISDNGADALNHKIFFKDGPETDDSYDNLGKVGSNINYGLRWAEVSNAPLYLNKGTMGEGGVRVPALIKMPGDQGLTGRLEHIARVDDLAPTFLEIAGLKDPGAEFQGQKRLPITGKSMVPMLEHGSDIHRDDDGLGAELFGNAYYREGKWKLLSAKPGFHHGYEPFDWQLFNMQTDPGETTDLADQYPERVEAMKKAWWEYADKVGIVFPEGFSKQ